MMLQNPAANELRFGKTAHSRKAFTILEVLVVLFILGMLVTVLFRNADRIIGQGSESVASIFVNESIRTPLVTYRMHMGGYPSTEQGLEALISAPSNNSDRWRGPYLEGGEIPLDPWNNPYQYRHPGEENPDSYDVFSFGPDGVDSDQNIGNW